MHRHQNRGVLPIMLAAITWGTVGVTTKTLDWVECHHTSLLLFSFAWRLPSQPCWRAAGSVGAVLFHVAWRDVLGMLLMGGMTAISIRCVISPLSSAWAWQWQR